MNGKEECRGIPCYFVSLSEGRYKWYYTYHVISFSNESTATAHSTCQGSTDPLMSKYCNRTTWLKKDLSRLFLFGSPRSPHARILKQIFLTWQSIVRLKRKWRGKMIARISVSFSPVEKFVASSVALFYFFCFAFWGKGRPLVPHLFHCHRRSTIHVCRN